MTRTFAGVDITSGGRKENLGLALSTSVGIAALTVAFLQHGWICIGLTIVAAIFLFPISMLIAITVGLVLFGAAIRGLTNSRPNPLQRLALLLMAASIGAFLGLTVPGSPSEFIVTPLGLIWAWYLVRDGHYRSPGVRRRGAVAVVVTAACAAATGLWLLG